MSRPRRYCSKSEVVSIRDRRSCRRRGDPAGLTVKTSLNAADSDHESFLDKNSRVLTIEGADHSGHEIHSARNTLDRINFDLALEYCE